MDDTRRQGIAPCTSRSSSTPKRRVAVVSLVPLSSGGGFGLELESSELAKKYVESSTRHHLDFSHLPRSLARVVV